jgi:hypothetical protein
VSAPSSVLPLTYYERRSVPTSRDLKWLSEYCHVSQWLTRGFGLVNRFIGSSLVVTTITFCTLKINVSIAHKVFTVSNTPQLNSHKFPWRHRVLDSWLLIYDWLQTTFMVPYKPSERIYRRQVTWSLSTVVWRHCLHGSLFTASLTSNGRPIVKRVSFCANVFIDPLPGNALTCHNILHELFITSLDVFEATFDIPVRTETMILPRDEFLVLGVHCPLL